MSNETDTGDTGGDAPDFGFVPETFKGEDGAYDTARFRTTFDELSAFKAQEDERAASLPKEPGDYGFSLAEDHQWPEGFDPAKMVAKDEAGNDVAFDPSKLFDANDPDVSAVQAILHKHKAPPGMMSELASIMANREIRAVMKDDAIFEAEHRKLGPEAQARINTLSRTLNSMLPKEQAKALLDSLTRADALRAAESLLKNSTRPVSPSSGQADLASMSIDERIALGIAQRKRA
jgi:hypothetical protein